MKRCIAIFLTGIILLGCSSIYDQAVQEADQHFEQGKFKKALHYYEQALEEEKENTDIQQVVDHLQSYIEITGFMKKDKWREAEAKVELLLEENIASPLDEAIKSYETEINVAMTKITNLEEMLDEMDELLDNRKIDDIKDLMEEVEENEFFTMVENEVEKRKDSLSIVEKTIEKEEQTEVEKRNKDEKKRRKKEVVKTASEAKVKEKDKKESQLGQQKVFLKRLAELEYIQDNEKEETGGTQQIREFIWSRTEKWDEELNKAYQIIMDHHPNADTIRDEQRKWLKKIEDESSRIYRKEITGGTIMHIESDQYRFEETKKRAYELVNHYME